ncbi:MAG: ribbon-helix-helix protein, CopG family [Ruminococcus sp.]
MSDEDVQILEECCRLTGKSKADIIREGIREVYAETKNRDSPHRPKLDESLSCEEKPLKIL